MYSFMLHLTPGNCHLITMLMILDCKYFTYHSWPFTYAIVCRFLLVWYVFSMLPYIWFKPSEQYSRKPLSSNGFMCFWVDVSIFIHPTWFFFPCIIEYLSYQAHSLHSQGKTPGVITNWCRCRGKEVKLVSPGRTTYIWLLMADKRKTRNWLYHLPGDSTIKDSARENLFHRR